RFCRSSGLSIAAHATVRQCRSEIPRSEGRIPFFTRQSPPRPPIARNLAYYIFARPSSRREKAMSAKGWKQLVAGWPWFRGGGGFPLLPNSEFMQPVRLGRKPYGTWDTLPLAEDDPWGWPISEYEENLLLHPGLCDLARHVLAKLVPLARADESHDISEFKL